MTAAEWAKYTEAQYERCAKDYLYWRQSGLFCFSTDKRVGTMPMPDKPYNLLISALLENRSLKVKMFPKTRQMMMSWEIAAYYTWYAQFHPDSENLVINKKEEDSAYMVALGKGKFGQLRSVKPAGRGRVWNVYKNQPEWLKELCPAVASFNLVEWSGGGWVHGLPEGEEQLQGYQPANVWFDECGFMEQFEAHYFAALPMAENIHASSTPNGPGEYYRHVMDRQESYAMN